MYKSARLDQALSSQIVHKNRFEDGFIGLVLVHS